MMIRTAARLATAVVLALAPVVAPPADELGDVKFTRKGEAAENMSIPPATFPHGIHRMLYKCGACHDDLFPMKSGSVEITMDTIQDGKSCGVCHNGTIAFPSSFSTCARCHR